MSNSSIDHYLVQMAKYEAEILAYNAQVEMHKALIDNYAHTLQIAWNPIVDRQEKEMAEPQGKEVFTVIEVANGYVANVRGGGMVVGATLSDVCTAAQAEAASVKLKQEQAGNAQYPDYAQQVAAQSVEKFKHTYGPNKTPSKSDPLANQMLKFLFGGGNKPQ